MRIITWMIRLDTFKTILTDTTYLQSPLAVLKYFRIVEIGVKPNWN